MESRLLNVQCTYKDCSKYFETAKLMKRHKRDDPDHCYCKRCDVDCLDWEDLTLHKVLMMQPWLEGKLKPKAPGDGPEHIVCEFCGEDFQTFEGRKKHRELHHPADQNIFCPGCAANFTRASQLIVHFEENKCPEIQYIDYERNVQQKHIQKQIMKDPQHFAQAVAGMGSTGPLSSTCVESRSERETGTETDTDGGIALLDDDDDPAQELAYKPLQPEVELINLRMSKHAPAPRRTQESWPRIASPSVSSMTESLRSISINSPSPSIMGMSASDFATAITSHKGAFYTESYPSLSSQPRSQVEEDDDTASVTTTTKFSVASQPTAWTTGAASRALFKDAKPTPASSDYWASALQEREDAVVGQSTNLFHNRVWDPESAHYNVHRFYNPLIERYCCPIPECEGAYEDGSYLEEHFKITHLRIQYRCRHCLKIFQKASSLIAHCESAGGKCKVKDTNEFNQMLDDFSGGFLTSESIRQPKIIKQNTGKALVKKDSVLDGVMTTKFTAIMPEFS